jgi:hypothetical protein
MNLINATIAEYNVTGTEANTDKFQSVYQRSEEIHNTSLQIQEKVFGQEASEDQPWERMIKGSYDAIKLIDDSFEMIYYIIDALAQEFGVPAFVLPFIVTTIIVVVIFAAIYLFFRVKG